MTGRDRRTYEFRIAGHLDDRWSSWFADLEITCREDGSSTLTGEVADQSQLHGILGRIRDIGATLVSLRTMTDDDRVTAATAGPVLGLCGQPHGDW